MADFFLSCDTYSRLATIVEGYEPSRDRQSLKSVYVENRGGHTFAVACCSTLMVVEYVGKTNEPDAMVNLTIDPALVNQCKTEVAFKSGLTVNVNEMLSFATAKTSFGYVHPANAAIWNFGQNWLASWRNYLPKEPVKKTKGFMHWYCQRIATLATASPSGRVIFPEFIDVEKPTVIRDVVDVKWFGVVIPDFDPNEKHRFDFSKIEPGKVPDWAL